MGGQRKTLKEVLIKMLKKKTVKEKICAALIAEAENGSMKAFEVIRDTIGEKNAATIQPVSSIKIEVIDAKENGN